MRVVRASQRCGAKVALLINVALLAAHAHAQTPGTAFDLEWDAPASCLNEAGARDEISALIRETRDTGERARARVLIEGTEQRGFVARIEIARGPSEGERELRGTRCDAIGDAAVLIIAMAIDPEGAAARAAAQQKARANTAAPDTTSQPAANAARESKTTAQRGAQKTEQPEQPDAEKEPAEPDQEDEQDEQEEQETEDETEDEPSDPRRSGRLVLGVHGAGDAGSLPRATLGAGLIAGMHWPQLRLELHLLAFLPQTEQLPAPGASAELELYSGAIRGCFDVLGTRDTPRSLGTCAAIEAGLSHAAPRNISDGQASAGFWLAGFAGLDLRQHLAGPAHLRLQLEAGLPLLRPAYEIAPLGQVFRASPALGRLGISAFVLFP